MGWCDEWQRETRPRQLAAHGARAEIIDKTLLCRTARGQSASPPQGLAIAMGKLCLRP